MFHIFGTTADSDGNLANESISYSKYRWNASPKLI